MGIKSIFHSDFETDFIKNEIYLLKRGKVKKPRFLENSENFLSNNSAFMKTHGLSLVKNPCFKCGSLPESHFFSISVVMNCNIYVYEEVNSVHKMAF